MNSNARIRKDASLISTKALPAAGANVDCDKFDLEATNLWPASEAIDVILSLPATTALVATKVITFTFQDSADGTTFAAIPQLATFTVTGKTGNGSDATSTTVKLPPSTKRYINVNASVPADAGTVTAQSFTLSLAF